MQWVHLWNISLACITCPFLTCMSVSFPCLVLVLVLSTWSIQSVHVWYHRMSVSISFFPSHQTACSSTCPHEILGKIDFQIQSQFFLMQGASQTGVLWDSAHIVWFIGLSSAILVLNLSAFQPSVCSKRAPRRKKRRWLLLNHYPYSAGGPSDHQLSLNASQLYV